MATIQHDKRFRKTDDLENKAMKMRIVADSSANLLEMKDVEFASVPVHIIVGERALCCYYAEPGSVMVGFEA